MILFLFKTESFPQNRIAEEQAGEVSFLSIASDIDMLKRTAQRLHDQEDELTMSFAARNVWWLWIVPVLSLYSASKFSEIVFPFNHISHNDTEKMKVQIAIQVICLSPGLLVAYGAAKNFVKGVGERLWRVLVGTHQELEDVIILRKLIEYQLARLAIDKP